MLIFPSICYENYPLVLHVILMSKTPVIASNIGAIPEFIKDNENRFLFEAGNSGDLYRKMKLMIENSNLIQKLRANIGPVKTIKDQVKELENVYRDLMR